MWWFELASDDGSHSDCAFSRIVVMRRAIAGCQWSSIGSACISRRVASIFCMGVSRSSDECVVPSFPCSISPVSATGGR